MNGFTGFISNPQVHDTVLYTMAVTSFIAALPKWGSVKIGSVVDAAGVLYRFFYDWLVGFWSMKTGQPIHPADPTTPETPAKLK